MYFLVYTQYKLIMYLFISVLKVRSESEGPLAHALLFEALGDPAHDAFLRLQRVPYLRPLFHMDVERSRDPKGENVAGRRSSPPT